MLKKDIISNQMNVGGAYLNDIYDEAIVGYAERSTLELPIPAYSSQALKSILLLTEKSPSKVYSKLTQLLSNTGSVIVHTYPRKILWALINDNRFPVWENLNTAVIGVGRVGWGEVGVAYNKTLCIKILMGITETLGSEIELRSNCHSFIDTGIIPVKFVSENPWYVTPVK